MSLALGLRLLWREWRGGELRLLMIALTIAISASCAVGFFTDRVEQALIRQATEFLGADLVLRSAHPSQDDLRQQALKRGLSYSEQQVFPSMISRGDQLLLVSVKAVDQHYPLKGQLKLATTPNTAPRPHQQPPRPGTLWGEPRVLQGITAQVGDHVGLGVSRLRLSGVLLHEPDRGGGLFSLRPRVIMHLDDLAATKLVQPGSRVSYRYLFNGDPQAIAELRTWLQSRLRSGERLLDIHQENPSIGGTLQRAQRYLNLSGLLAVAMAAIAIAMAARRYSERHFDTAALLRSLGLTRRRLLILFSLQLLTAGLLSTFAGILCGWLAQQGLVALLARLLPAALPAPSWQPALVGAATGLLILLAVTLAPILRLASVPPLRVLRRDLVPLASGSLLIYGMAGTGGLLLLWLYSNDLALSLLLGGAGVSGALLLAATGWLTLQLLARLPGPLAWRLAIKNLHRHPQSSLTQLAAFGLTLAAMALILVVRTDLLRDWQAQLPVDAPNHFLINIQPWEIEPLESYLEAQQISHSGIYPMIRGRLSHINGTPATEFIPADSPGRRGTRRELNLTWSEQLAPDNRIVAGRWWRAEDRGKALVSVEQKLAQDLGVGVGDSLRFSFGDRTIDTRIQSLRSLDWSSMRPNFFVIFAPAALQELPTTAITSFHLPPDRNAELPPLLQRFPTLTLLEVGPLLGNIRLIVSQVSLAVEYVLLFVLAAGITVLFAGLANSIDERLQEGALLRTLGARSRLLRRMLAIEFLLLGLLAGLLAALLAQGATLVLYDLLDLTPRFNPLLWLLTPLSGALLVWLAGYLGTRKIMRHSPLSVLRDQQS